MKTALITGITGQDGAYLAEFLLKKRYIVHGLKRRASSFNTQRIDNIYSDPFNKKNRLTLHYGDMTDSLSLIELIKKISPDEIYNLAAMSHVNVSFSIPEYVANVDALGTLRILEAVRILKLEKKTKIYQASTSELYGNAEQIPQNEETPFKPKSPYAVAKLYSYWTIVNYRESYNIFACNGILFNHESPKRGETFVTRKITMGVVNIILGKQEKIFLGNLNAKRDWGHAKDYVQAMWKILQYKKPEDWVIATGKSYSIKDLLTLSFSYFKINIKFLGKGLKEKAVVVSCKNPKYQINKNQVVVEVKKRYYRPSEVNELLGDSSKAKKKLNWRPKYQFKDLVEEMIKSDYNKLKND